MTTGPAAPPTATMDEVIAGLLRLARFSQQPMDVDHVDMHALLSRAVAELAPTLDSRTVELKIGPIPPAVGDGELLFEVWRALLDNAFKFTADRDDGVVEVAGTPTPEHVVYAVRDNGCGFPPEDDERIFRLFERAHNVDDAAGAADDGGRDPSAAPASACGGSGVGLAVVEAIVKRHGGWVRALGRPGVGATFFFALPWNGPH